MRTNKNTGTSIEKSRTQTIEVNSAAAAPVRSPAPVFTPAVDLTDAGGEYILTADLPGANRESLEVTLEQQMLTIAAAVQAPPHPGSAALREYQVGDFRRAFRVGEDIDPAAIRASYTDGVLTVQLPKREQAVPRRIEIAAN